MKLKKCKECGQLIGKDRKSGHYWCPNCREVREDFNKGYRIVVMGKNGGLRRGKWNFINCMARALRSLGHDVIALSDEELYQIIPMHDMSDCLRFKKPINLKAIQYKYDPDFIFVEQMYYRFDVSEVTCPVIYQHREYTHFPDIVHPDMLLASYYWRLRAFEFYHPWEYHNIPYKDYLYVAVDPEQVKPVEDKIIEGIVNIGLHIPMSQFRTANGPIGDLVMEQQEIFWEECRKTENVASIPEGLSGDEFIDMLGKCEAILLDAGRFGGITRRLFEAMASKTLCVVKVHNGLMASLFEEVGLTDEMCIFVKTAEDVAKIKFTDEERQKMVNKAYEWVIANHTYEVRAKELLDKFEQFKEGIKGVTAHFMGWSLKYKMTVEDGEAIIEE